MKNYLLFFLLSFSLLTIAQNNPQTGLLFDDDVYEKVPLKARNVAFQDVVGEEANTSLRKFLPNIRNQKQYGTCAGWASAYYGRTILNARINELTDVTQITDQAFSPVFTYLNSNIDNDYNCQGGAYISKAMKTMVEKGSPFFNDYDVLCDTSIPESVEELAKENKIKGYSRLFTDQDENIVRIESVKRSLLNGNPVIIGFQVQNSLYTAKNVFEPDGGEYTGGHAMCVISYDDDKYGGAFEVVNSWGSNWGNDGLIWIRYDDFATHTKYAFEMIPTVKQRKTEKKILAGSLDLKLYDGTTMDVSKGTGTYKKSVLGWQDVVMDEETESIGDYATTTAYARDTRYRMYAKVNKPAYVYVIGADSNGDSGVLFPHEENISPYIAYENTSVIVPGERYWFRLNSDVESDYSVVIFSEEEVDINEAKQRLDTMDGELLDKLYIIFKEDLISKEEVKLNENKMGFNASYDNGSMALMVLDIKRS